MMKSLMSAAALIAVVAFTVPASAAANTATGAAASEQHHNDRSARHPTHHVVRGHHDQRDLVSNHRYQANAYGAASLPHRRGFFGTEQGVVDEACNLPSSKCTNDQRDAY